MLLDTLVCTSQRLSQIFPIDKGLLHHYVSGSDATPGLHFNILDEAYKGFGCDYSITDKKLKDSLDELEELLEKYTVTKVTYLNELTGQVLLNDGTIVFIGVENGGLKSISITRTLSKVLYGQLTFDGFISPSYMVLVCSGKLCLATNALTPEQFDKNFQCKIVNLDTDFCYITHIAVHGNKIMLWTPEGNIVIYSPIGPGVRELCRYTVPYRLCACSFNPLSSTVVTCQLKPSSQGAVFHAISITYDVVGKGEKWRMLEVIKHRITHVRADVICAQYNHAANKLLLGLETGKILLHCEQLKRNFTTDVATKQTLSSFTWHPSDTFFVVAMKSGYLQIYDETLQVITTSFGALPDGPTVDLNRIFNSQRNVSNVFMSQDHVAVMLERGPLITMRILMPHTDTSESSYFAKLLQMYIYRHQFKHVSRLLRNCLHRFTSEECLLAVTTRVIGELTTTHFNEACFAVGAEILLHLKKEKISPGGLETLQTLALKLILRALHNKLYREALKLGRKLDNELIIQTVDKYVKFCGLNVSCKSPEQIKLSKKTAGSKSSEVTN